MRKPKKVWVYKDYQLVKECKSIQEAADSTQETISTVRTYLDKPKASKRGYVFVSEPLTAEEMEHMPILEEKEPDERANGACKVKLQEGQELEVSCYDHRAFLLERSKEARKAQLRQYIYTRLRPYWLTVPQQVSSFERRFLQEIIDSF